LAELRFEWDAAKAADNALKHDVTFEEAQTAFDDPNVVIEYDEEHSREEDRRRAIGFSYRWRLISVIYTKRDEETIRLISARRTTPAEARRYAG
jgi:uncharacterized DUF497 family protein